MTAKELRNKKDKEVQAFVEKWVAELAMLKIQASVGQCEKSSRIGLLRKDIARAKTIMNERELHGHRED